jgi:thioredoxin reductase (NADPH)
VGGGNSAGQAALFLAASGCPVTLVMRGSELGKSMSRYLADRIEAHPAITVRTGTTVGALHGHDVLDGVTLDVDGRPQDVPAAGLFTFIGAVPSTDWLSGRAALDPAGFIRTDRALGADDLDDAWTTLGRTPLPFESSQPGLFAVGDVRAGSMKRVASAVGEGSAAVRSVHEHLAFHG